MLSGGLAGAASLRWGPYCQLFLDVTFYNTSFYYKPRYTNHVTKLHYKITKNVLYILYSVYIVLHDIHYKACGYTRYRCIDVERLSNTVSMYGMRYTVS